MPSSKDFQLALARAVRSHPSNDAAVDSLRRYLAAHKSARLQLWEQHEAEVLRNLVLRARHRDTCEIKTAVRAVDLQALASVARSAQRSIFMWSIGGKRLGDLFGRELPDIIAREARSAAGRTLNVEFLSRLHGIVDENKTIRQAMKEADVAKLFRAVSAEILGDNTNHATVGHDPGDSRHPPARRRAKQPA